jgi:hypothetical protein
MPCQQVQVFYLCCLPFLLFNPPFLVSFVVFAVWDSIWATRRPRFLFSHTDGFQGRSIARLRVHPDHHSRARVLIVVLI